MYIGPQLNDFYVEYHYLTQIPIFILFFYKLCKYLRTNLVILNFNTFKSDFYSQTLHSKVPA